MGKEDRKTMNAERYKTGIRSIQDMRHYEVPILLNTINSDSKGPLTSIRH
jgi:hypothetical protein